MDIMKNSLNCNRRWMAVAFLLAGTLAVAQTTPVSKKTSPRNGNTGEPAGRQDPSRHVSAIAVDHAGGNGVRRMDGGGAGSGAQPAAGGKSTGGNSANKVHAASKAAKNGPEAPRGGVNPLYESKDKADLKPTSGTAAVQPYKDPADRTTRYRPGNNKTTVKSKNQPASAPPHP